MNLNGVSVKVTNKRNQSSVQDLLEKNRMDFENHPAAALFSDTSKNKKNDEVEDLLKVIPGRFEKLEKSLKVNAIWRNVLLVAIVCGLGILIFRPDTKEAAKTVAAVPTTPAPATLKIVTVKFINLRSKPSTSGTKLLVISPNQKLEVLESKNDWRFVSYYDYVNKKSVKGWVYFSRDGFLALK